MSTVVEIIDAVKNLDEREKGEFLEKLTEIDFDDAWDRQIVADANAGRLDHLWQQALEDIEARIHDIPHSTSSAKESIGQSASRVAGGPWLDSTKALSIGSGSARTMSTKELLTASYDKGHDST
jgi:hypothetical protein